MFSVEVFPLSYSLAIPHTHFLCSSHICFGKHYVLPAIPKHFFEAVISVAYSVAVCIVKYWWHCVQKLCFLHVPVFGLTLPTYRGTPVCLLLWIMDTAPGYG